MTINPALFQRDPSTPDAATKRALSFEYDKSFGGVRSSASATFLSNQVLTDIDSALKLFLPTLTTRKDFMITATLWALDCIQNDPKVALRKLAATGAVTGAVTKVAGMDDQHGCGDGEAL